MARKATQVHFSPKILNLAGPDILISTTGVTTTAANLLGTEMKLFVGVYGYKSDGVAGWMRLLYESLTDFSEHRHSMAIFKLVTSIEILCDRTLERYLESKKVAPLLTTAILKSNRNWDTRFNRIRAIVKDYLKDDELNAFLSAGESFSSVRKFRNAFAHDDPQKPDHAEASKAFETSFSLIWGLDKINTSLHAATG